ncbi:peptide chain release factor N(5)-glutamine methyltransferase [Sodalinema gerasimenkoae]|uniref:peptide chain release factor N(5)-glutamine methyltransferase n=1 Tax=Sodalinema gerasimenkoae TaxID=2862348 RepID=UPI001359F891|nr:peptide chain release factor N(5)-glutamine methyltransferase [Sodalinema gerasimenkoae]
MSQQPRCQERHQAQGVTVEVTVAQVRAWRNQARSGALAGGIDPAEVDWLLYEGARLERLTFRLGQPGDRLSLSRSLEELTQFWQQRLGDRTPVQYLLGSVPWRNLNLLVSPAVLIPRPETEAIIDIILETQGADSAGIWVDLGTGSGAIALGLAQALCHAKIHAVDCSAEALKLARSNAERHGLGDRIQFHQGSWFDPLVAQQGQLAGMLSNPPYIPSGEIPHLQPEVSHHEPHLALDGGDDGLTALRHLVQTAPQYLQPGGLWLVEIMSGQSPAVCQLLQDSGNYEVPQVIHDFAGHDRFVLTQTNHR